MNNLGLCEPVKEAERSKIHKEELKTDSKLKKSCFICFTEDPLKL